METRRELVYRSPRQLGKSKFMNKEVRRGAFKKRLVTDKTPSSKAPLAPRLAAQDVRPCRDRTQQPSVRDGVAPWLLPNRNTAHFLCVTEHGVPTRCLRDPVTILVNF